MVQQQRQNEQILLIELLVDDLDAEATEIWCVTPTVHLRVPKDADSELVAAIIDAICRC